VFGSGSGGWLSWCLSMCSRFMFMVLKVELVFWLRCVVFEIRPRTNYRRDVSSGVVLFVWCSVLVVLVIDV
jgi:hypothetical protein